MATPTEQMKAVLNELITTAYDFPNSREKRRALCDAIMKRRGDVWEERGDGIWWVGNGKKGTRKWGCSLTTTLFGCYEKKYYMSKEAKWNTRHIYYNHSSGVEVLGLRPFAKGTTYSRECQLNIQDLKERCKMNGVKPKSAWKKVDYLHALMKV